MTDNAPKRARRGDRTYELPERFTQFFHSDGVTGDDEVRWELAVQCTVHSGRVAFERIELVAHGEPLTPADVQRLPWGQIATFTAESNAATNPSERLKARRAISTDQARRSRQESRERKRRAVIDDGDAERTAVDTDKLRQVLALRAEAEAVPTPYAEYVAERMGYSTAYVRRLAKRARDEL